MDDIIECAICFKQCKGQVPGSHLKKHNLRVSEYEKIYGSSRTNALIEKCRKGAKQGGGGNIQAVLAAKQKAEERKVVYYAQPKKCISCLRILPYEKHKRTNFCNNSCSAAHNNKNRMSKFSTNSCLSCGKLLGRRGKYCNQTCQYAFERLVQFEKWKNGEIIGGSEFQFSASLRRVLIAENGNKCSVCGWGCKHPKTGLYPLHVDHINGDCTDHKYDNLRILCPNCHSLTDNFGSLNKNNKGRAVRRREKYT